MPKMKAALFDFGGTLFDYEAVAPGERESVIDIARWAGADREPREKMSSMSIYRARITCTATCFAMSYKQWRVILASH
jgi:FMN phosphatase YigB (HAD superfamily)